MIRTLKDIDVKGKRVLVRVDFNVPLKAGKVKDDTRIRAAIPTLKALITNGAAAVVLVTHLGRPKGEDDSLRLDPVAKRLQVLLKKKVIKLDDCVGTDIRAAVGCAPKGSVILLENVRFHPEEEENDPRFARQLASLADIYVNDAFGTAHRAHASTEGITKFLPSAAGLLLEREIRMLGEALHSNKRPFIAILGGAKVGDKIGVLTNLLKKADAVLIGGAMMFTFLKSTGKDVGKSLVEEDKLKLAKTLLKKKKILLPVDTVVSKSKDKPSGAKTVKIDNIPKGMIGVDIGPETAAIYAEIISRAKTVVWNGPMGVFEVNNFSKGTMAIAKAISKVKGLTVIGGGESVEAINKAGIYKKITHVSTGGGASLEFLEGKRLPGIKALEC